MEYHRLTDMAPPHRMGTALLPLTGTAPPRLMVTALHHLTVTALHRLTDMALRRLTDMGTRPLMDPEEQRPTAMETPPLTGSNREPILIAAGKVQAMAEG
ncbi:MAG: hypothetical protein ACOZF2_04260 [Thermodesulfobacteriota bacterium]